MLERLQRSEAQCRSLQQEQTRLEEEHARRAQVCLLSASES